MLCPMLLGACATYDQPKDTAPHASAVFKRSAGSGGNLITQGRLLSYYIATNDDCSEAPRTAFFGTGDLSGNEKSIRLKSGEPIKLLAFMKINDAGFKGGTYQRIGQNRCVSEAMFTPINGQSYDIAFEMDAASCALNITNSQSKTAPSDLIVDEKVCVSKPKTIPDD